MDLDELQIASLRAQLLLQACAHVGMHRLDQGRFAHAARAPKQRVVGGQAAGKALGIFGKLRGHGLEALQELERNAVYLTDGLEAFALGLPDERLGSVEIGLDRGRSRQPFQCGGEALEPREEGRFIVHHGSRK